MCTVCLLLLDRFQLIPAEIGFEMEYDVYGMSLISCKILVPAEIGLEMEYDVYGMSSSRCDLSVLPGAPAGGCAWLWSAPIV